MTQVDYDLLNIGIRLLVDSLKRRSMFSMIYDREIDMK